MVDDAFDVDKFMDQIQDTTECADSSVLSQFATDLNDNPSSVTATIETSAEDEIINAGSNPDFYEDEPDAELYKVPIAKFSKSFQTVSRRLRATMLLLPLFRMVIILARCS